MNRKSFIKSHGATCKNWTWSWSFVNEAERFVIFGAWQHHAEVDRTLILGEGWAHRQSDGRKSTAYPQSREHVRLVQSGGYRLFTFPIYISNDLQDKDGDGPSKIDRFSPVLTQKTLRQEGDNWYAYDYVTDVPIPEEIEPTGIYLEGASKIVTVNAYERNRKARDACIAVYGAVCSVCNFDFEKYYGREVKGLIHVHHLIPLSDIREQYELDPVKDLRPVCPNCHAVIHYGNEIISIDEVKERIRRARLISIRRGRS